MDAVYDQALRAREQGRIHRHDPVPGHPSFFDEPLVALAHLRRRGAVDGAPRDREVAQARVEGAGEELVYAGDRGEAFLIGDGVWGAECDQGLHPPVPRVAPASVRGSPPMYTLQARPPTE